MQTNFPPTGSGVNNADSWGWSAIWKDADESGANETDKVDFDRANVVVQTCPEHRDEKISSDKFLDSCSDSEVRGQNQTWQQMKIILDVKIKPTLERF